MSAKALENTMIPLTTKSMGGGSITAILGYLSSSGAAVLIGVLVTILGFLFNIYFQRKKHIREHDEWVTKKSILEAEERRREELHIAQLNKYKGSNE